MTEDTITNKSSKAGVTYASLGLVLVSGIFWAISILVEDTGSRDHLATSTVMLGGGLGILSSALMFKLGAKRFTSTWLWLALGSNAILTGVLATWILHIVYISF